MQFFIAPTLDCPNNMGLTIKLFIFSKLKFQMDRY